MNIIETGLEGCFILEPKVFGDSRGYFFESYNFNTLNKLLNLDVKFLQDNQSYSTKGVLRGLHAQKGEFSQAKLVRVLQGEVLDVAVDARVDSSTFGKSFSTVLSAENKRQMFIPRGFLHGFIVLSEFAEFFYKCDNLYNKESEWGVIYNDEELDIDWKLPTDGLIVSEKDNNLPSFSEAISSLDLIKQ